MHRLSVCEYYTKHTARASLGRRTQSLTRRRLCVCSLARSLALSTQEAKRRISNPTDEERAQKAGPTGTSPSILNLINESDLTKVLKESIGEFDPPTACQVGTTPTGPEGDANMTGRNYNLVGYKSEGFPYYNAVRILPLTQ